MIVNCLICDKEMETNPCLMKRNEGKFCSKKCCGIYIRGRIPWNKGKKMSVSEERTCKECEKSFRVYPKRLNKNRGKYCSRDCFFKSPWSKPKYGSEHWNWRGGISEENHMIRTSKEYKQWRKLIFDRDNYICQVCGRTGGKLRANHIKRFADYPDLRLDPSNGITICEACDNKLILHREEGWESYFNLNLATRRFLEDEFIGKEEYAR